MMTMSHGLLALALMSGLGLAACSPPPPTQWQEEVELSDGRVMRVDRIQEWKVTQPLGSSRSFLSEATQLRLVGNTAPIRPWGGFAESPLVFDFDTERQEFVVVAIPRTCERYYQLGKPRPPYREYRYRDGTWISTALSTTFIGRKPNLLVYPSWENESPFISLAAKADRNSRRLSFPEMQIREQGGLPAC